MNVEKILRKFLALALVAVMLMSLVACGSPEETADPTGQTEQTTEATDSTQESSDIVLPFVDEDELIPEAEPPVEISMPEYELTYSGTLKDVIVVEELNDQDPKGLKFTVVLTESQEHIFTLFFNSDQGDMVTVLTDADGNRIPVAFQMAVVPEGLNEADELTFYAAQEAVNEIVASLKLK